jgi:hypothetical protein
MDRVRDWKSLRLGNKFLACKQSGPQIWMEIVAKQWNDCGKWQNNNGCNYDDLSIRNHVMELKFKDQSVGMTAG